jgi:hypothetical protein
MAVKLVILVDDPDGALATGSYGAGADIELQSSAVEAFTTPAVVADIPLVAATFTYTHWDAAGTTATWYRWRLTNTGDTETGEWSAPFQGWDPATAARLSGANATLDELLGRLPERLPSTSTHKLARMERALIDATERLASNELVGYPFMRSPQSGADEARVVEIDCDGIVHVHGGIISVTSARIRRSTSADWEAITVTDLQLEYWAGGNRALAAPDGEPFDHVTLTGRGSLVTWPRTHAGIELTGAWQWPRIPRPAVNATCDLARQMLAADPTFAGAVVGPDQLGRPVGPNRLPDSVYRLNRAMSHRFACDT